MELRIAACPNPKYNWSNRVYISKESFATFRRSYEKSGGRVVDKDPSINIALGNWVFLARFDF